MSTRPIVMGLTVALEQLSPPMDMSALSAAPAALKQGVAELESLVRAAAKAAARLGTFRSQPAEEIRRAAEQVGFLSIGLAEIALINDKYGLDLSDIKSPVSRPVQIKLGLDI